jgi:hypothetical protein
VTENRDFLEGLYSKKMVAFGRERPLEYSVFMTPLASDKQYIAPRQQKLIEIYSDTNPNHFVASDNTVFEKYLADNQKEFCYYPQSIFVKYDKEILTTEIRKYFQEYFSSIEVDPVNKPLQMDLTNYPENATTPNKFHEILVDLLLRAKYDLIQNATQKDFYKIKEESKSSNETMGLVQYYPGFCTKDGFAGKILVRVCHVSSKTYPPSDSGFISKPTSAPGG